MNKGLYGGICVLPKSYCGRTKGKTDRKQTHANLATAKMK